MSNHTQRTLQDWQDYIEDYEQKLNAQQFDLSTADGRRDYAMMNAHLQSLRSKYAYLQQYYAEHGELPENITFEAIEGGAGAYRTEQDGEIKSITFVGGGNGGLTVSAPDFSGAYHWEGPETLIASSYEDTSNPPYKYGIEITGPAGAGYISMEVTGTLFSGMDRTYHFHYENIPSTWTVQLNINNTIPVYDQTSPLGMNAFTFNGGVVWSLDEMTVPTDEPWKYYEEEIKPNVDPSNDIYPDGYEPPRDNSDEDPDTDEPVPGPDKNDRGANKLPKIDGKEYPAIASPFVSYGIFKYEDLVDLSEQLWDKPDNFFEGLSAAQKVNPMDYFISLRWYPIILSSPSVEESDLFLGRGGKLIVNHRRLNKTVFISDFGKIKIKPHYENFLDYDPYTKIYIFLPFCGQIELNTCVVMNKDLSLNCAIDVSDGSICWQLYNDTDEQPIFTKQAKCGCDIPITSADASQMGANIVNATLGLLNAVGKTGADIYTGATSAMEKAAPTAAEGIVAGGTGTTGGLTKAAIAGGAYGLAKNITNIISACSNLGMASKEIPQMTGSVAGLAASLVDRCPYIIYQRPLSTNPDTYGHTVGFIHNKTALISETHGFTICKNADVSGISQATTREKEEIKHILDNGFFA